MMHEHGTGGNPKYGIIPQMPLTSVEAPVNILDNNTYSQPRVGLSRWFMFLDLGWIDESRLGMTPPALGTSRLLCRAVLMWSYLLLVMLVLCSIRFPRQRSISSLMFLMYVCRPGTVFSC